MGICQQSEKPLAIVGPIVYTIARRKGYGNMNELEYLLSHQKFIDSALNLMRGRVQIEDLEDAEQQLKIVIIKCLRKYDPAYGVPLDAYVNKSIRKKVRGIMGHFIEKSSVIQTKKCSNCGNRMPRIKDGVNEWRCPQCGTVNIIIRKPILSLESTTFSGGEEEFLSETIPSEDDWIAEVDRELLTDALLSGLSPELRGMVKMWAAGCILKDIADQYGTNYETVRVRIKSALDEMRILCDDEEMKKRLL